MDDQLEGHVQVSPDIDDALRRSAALLVVLSPGYLASRWCTLERETFLESVRQQLDAGSRVFVVERDRVARDGWPDEFRGVIGYQFWEPGRGDIPRILGDPVPDLREDSQYFAQLNNLSYELAAAIKRLRPAPAAVAPSVPADGGPVVYLALTTDDLNRRREAIRQYLLQLGLRVVPEGWYPFAPAELRASAGRDIGRASLFVQLLSDEPGSRPPDLPQGLIGLQLELAEEVGKPILQWRPDFDLDTVNDPVHRALLARPNVRVEGIEEFKAEVVRRAKASPSPARPKRPGYFVFVNALEADKPLADEVARTLEQWKIAHALPAWGEPDYVEDLKDQLAACDAFLIIYGTSTLRWVRTQYQESRRVSPERQSDFSVIGVYVGPPEPKAPLNFFDEIIRVIDCRAGHDVGRLRTFLDAMVGEAGG